MDGILLLKQLDLRCFVGSCVCPSRLLRSISLVTVPWRQTIELLHLIPVVDQHWRAHHEVRRDGCQLLLERRDRLRVALEFLCRDSSQMRRPQENVHVGDGADVAVEGAQDAATRDVPHFDRGVEGGGDQQGSIDGQCEGGDGFGVACKLES